jgi:hypothetical protein
MAKLHIVTDTSEHPEEHPDLVALLEGWIDEWIMVRQKGDLSPLLAAHLANRLTTGPYARFSSHPRRPRPHGTR